MDIVQIIEDSILAKGLEQLLSTVSLFKAQVQQDLVEPGRVDDCTRMVSR